MMDGLDAPMSSTPLPDPALDGTTPLRVGVVSPRRRLAWVRVLHEALAQHHPAASLTALVLDGVSEGEPFEQVTPDDVIDDAAHWHRLAMILTHEELARALGPALALHLLADGLPVLLLADDVVVRGPLDDLARLARESGAVLVPRRRAPLPDDDRHPDAADMAKLGAHDEGIIGLSGEGELAAWLGRAIADGWLAGWREDSPLLDSAATQFSHALADDPAHGCARWNLDELDRDATRARTLRLPEFERAQAHLLAARTGEAPRVLLSEHPGLAAICQEHAERLRRHGEATSSVSYGLDQLACGLLRDNVVRDVYREALVSGTAHGDPEPPDPYDPGEADAFRAWLAEPVVRAADGFEVSRYLYEVYRCRGDLQALFPDVRSAAAQLVEWAHRYGRIELDIPTEVLPPREPAPLPRQGELQRDGVNVAGYFRSEFGIGEAARLLVDGLEAAQIPHVTAPIPAPRLATGMRSRNVGTASRSRRTSSASTSTASSSSPSMQARTSSPAPHGRLLVVGGGSVPDQLRPALDVVDEVWVGSDYVRVADRPRHRQARAHDAGADPRGGAGGHAAKSARAPRRVPVPLRLRFLQQHRAQEPTRADRGVSARVRRRRRRRRSWSRASTASTGWRSSRCCRGRRGSDRHRHHRPLRLGRGAGGMMAACDCYVSLHRSEGFGLTIAEAMALR